MTNYSLADLDKWASKTAGRMDAIVAGATERVCEIAQKSRTQGGRMPVDTGTLRNSFQSSLNGSTALSGATSFEMIVARMEAGDYAEFGWSAAYARRVNSGFVGEDVKGRRYNQKGAFFLEHAALQWPAIVASETIKAKAAVNG